MTGKGRISVAPNRRLRLWLAAHALWLATLFGMAAWWGRLLTRQASRIAELEAKLGPSLAAATAAHERLARTSRMMFWESGAFFTLLLAASVFLAWLTWREARRARALQAFFASVTHELRTPLTSIRLQAESIAESQGEGYASRLVQRLLEDTSRLEAQVERTLELARVEGGGPVRTRPLFLKSWLEYFLRNRDEALVKRVEIDADVAGCEVLADPGALQVILKNLLENTVRHAGRDRIPKVTLRAEAPELNGGWVQLVYRDDGPGFKGDVGKLGNLFHKGEDSPGAGVGLYLVSVLMKRMGGRAEFASDAGFQTTLRFRATPAEPTRTLLENVEHA